MKKADYLTYGLIGLGFIGLIVLYVFEFEWFNRTIHAGGLVRWSLLAGGLLGLALGYHFREQGEDLTGKIQIYIFFVALCAIFMPLFGSLSNRLLSFQQPAPVNVEFVKEEPYYAALYGLMEEEKEQPTGYYLFFFYQQEIHRIDHKQALFPNREPGDTIPVTLIKGLWGFEMVIK